MLCSEGDAILNSLCSFGLLSGSLIVVLVIWAFVAMLSNINGKE